MNKVVITGQIIAADSASSQNFKAALARGSDTKAHSSANLQAALQARTPAPPPAAPTPAVASTGGPNGQKK
jgi:hypothetical protein